MDVYILSFGFNWSSYTGCHIKLKSSFKLSQFRWKNSNWHGEKLVSKTIETESVVDRAIITKTNNCLKMLLVDCWPLTCGTLQLGAQQIFRVWKPNYLCHNVRNKIIHSMQNSKIHGIKIEIKILFPIHSKGICLNF